MSKNEVFNQDRAEKERFLIAKPDQEVLLPVTHEGFETMVAMAASLYDLPVDDGMRLTSAGFVHHIPNEICTISLQPLADVLYKSVSNTLTWKIDQGIKEKRNAEAKKKLAESASPDANVIQMEKPNGV